MLNREKLIVEEELEEEKRQYDMLLKEYKRMNVQRLELTKEKNQLSHKNAEKLLETSKFGSRQQQSIRNQTSSNSSKTFIVDFFGDT